MTKQLTGNPVSEGIALGKAYVYRPFRYVPSTDMLHADNADAEIKKYESAQAQAAEELVALIAFFTKTHENDKADILAAHKEILEDEEIDEGVRESILEEHCRAEYAVYKTIEEFCALIEKAKDPLIAARAADLRDVSSRLTRILSGVNEKNLSHLPSRVIVIAHDLLPSDTAVIDRDNVLGIVTEAGGTTSHSAIIARSYRIPAVLGVSGATDVISDGQDCIVDAINGSVYLSPDIDLSDKYRAECARFASKQRLTEMFSSRDGALADGKRILIGLNVGSDAQSEDYNNCDFIGLLRTEFLYMHSDHLPTEDEQYRCYSSIICNAKGRPITLRTLDIGGDKSLSYMDLPREDNPFLGNRALRFCLTRPDIFNTQLRAALRASALGPMQLMFPMVATLDDILAAREAVDEAKRELRRESQPFDEEIKLGIMIEIPAIVEIIDLVMDRIDFASVGTNDLTQYSHAVDRLNPTIACYYQSFSPSMMRILRRIFTAFNQAGKPCSVCGELGGDRLAALPLVGMGLSKLSMNGANIPGVKEVLSRFTMDQARTVANAVCSLPTQQLILEYLKNIVEGRAQDL